MSPQAEQEYETKLSTLPRSGLFGEYRKAIKAIRSGQSIAAAFERVRLCKRAIARRRAQENRQ